MINIVDLRIKQAEFEGDRQQLKKEFEKLDNKRQRFIKKFSKEKLKSLQIEEYVVGYQNKDTFCYWLETKLMKLGKIKGGSTADKKFGIYYGKTKSDPTLKYRFTKKFGNNETEAFENVKKAILDLLEAAKKGETEKIRRNPLSPMLKGKILSTYYPKKFLNIFANEHLKYFMDKLDMPYNETDDEIKEREILIDFKNKDEVMSKWTIYEYSKFLYGSFGGPLKREKAPEALKEYIESKKDYPKLREVNAEFIDLKINPVSSIHKIGGKKIFGKTIDFEKENKIHKLLGNRGEKIVFNLEKKYLKKRGKKELAERVEWVSKKDDSLGYDILSFEENGEEKHIEVKSTKQSSELNPNFLISINQYEKAKNLKNYYFYIVFNIKSKDAKVWKIKDPLKYENKGLTLTPISFRVVINTSQNN